MLKKRIIPKLLINGDAVVTTRKFSRRIPIGTPVSQAKIYQSQMVDELMFLNITPESGMHEFVKIARDIAENVFMPLTFGGGIRNVADIRLLLANGADKISLNSSAVCDPEMIPSAVELCGSQSVVVSIDYRFTAPEQAEVFTEGGSRSTGLDPVEYAVRVQELGAGEIVLCCIDHDGERSGLELCVARTVIDAVDIPVILSGGCARSEDFVSGFNAGADAVGASTYFCFKDENPMQCRAQVFNNGIPIRMHR